ncbi:major facilitator superfamily domain-containing protein [Diplogelasinospora grovesii]|uniref:Major facilitator superfamily domain-containing protein n=1 Tax=Diplogelasinospora grovesii TaxID=303347 RepID=A0AAN6SA95_9PEZI|nr:major facilitator superfamily domain-containing protein [Diplogelasinospora grovesii]
MKNDDAQEVIDRNEVSLVDLTTSSAASRTISNETRRNLNDFHHSSPSLDPSAETRQQPPVDDPPVINDGEKKRAASTFVAALLTAALSLATFTIGLDNTIIATAIPNITSSFDSLGDVGWYGSAYLLTLMALQPTFGKIYTYFDVKWTYLGALVIFEAGSVICAAAPSSPVFIVGRAVAGVGGAGLASGGNNIVALVVPIDKRATYLAFLTSTFGIAAVVGPLLGGVFTDRLTWRWCFWINLPFGAVAFAAVALIFRIPRERRHTTLTLREKIGKLDLPSAFFFIPSIVCLLLALQWGGVDYPWSDSRVWGCLLGFVLILACFIGAQIYRGDEATIPPRIMKQRTIYTSTAFIAFLFTGIYAHFYYLPFYFQVAQGTSAVDSGIRNLPYIIGFTLFAVGVGIAITTVGSYAPFAWVGASIFTVGAGLLHTLRVDSGSGAWIGYQVLAGVGSGMAVQVPFIAVQCVVRQDEIPIGNALVGFFNSLGSGVSVSVAQNIFLNSLEKGLEGISGIDPAAVIRAGATGVRLVTPPELLPAVLEAYNEAIMTTFIWSIAAGGVALLCSLFIERRSVKGVDLQMTV